MGIASQVDADQAAVVEGRHDVAGKLIRIGRIDPKLGDHLVNPLGGRLSGQLGDVARTYRAASAGAVRPLPAVRVAAHR
jgi:hypothetical protein